MNRSTASRRVLIVDDDAMTRELLSAMLRKAQYEAVGLAASADTAFRACQEQQPDLVLLDIALKDSDGLQVLETLRTTRPQTAVVMVSGEVFQDRVQRARQLGAAGFVAKPFTTERLLRALERARA